MRVARSCLSCRRAKVKCDRGRPSCRRCVRLWLECTGFPLDDIFRDENEPAQRNSRRARGEAGQSETEIQKRRHTPGRNLQLQHHHINRTTLATPLKRDLETRAVDRFFGNWILKPGKDGVSPGHMHDLPQLYFNAPENSVLWHAVRAVAFADVRNSQYQGVPFSIKARQSYGAALTVMQQRIALNEREISTDNVLAALLLVDSFESMYLAQQKPLGAHSTAIKFILNSRGGGQLYDRSQFALFRAANCRLQARQILLHEEPDPVQMQVLRMLDIEQPDVHLTVDIARATKLCADATKIVDEGFEQPRGTSEDSVDREMHLIDEMQKLITEIEIWTSAVTGIWKPDTVDARLMIRTNEFSYHQDHSCGPFICTELLLYPDVWFAYIWNFHTACQIVLRESLVGMITYSDTAQGKELTGESIARIQDQQLAVAELARSIIKSFPPLIGLAHGNGEAPHGQMAGRFLALAAMEIVRKARFALSEHKQTASKVVNWIYSSHAIF